MSDECKQPLREFFGALNDGSMSALHFCVGYPQLTKHMIEQGQRPSDEQLIQMMEVILESCQRHTSFMDEVKGDLYS
jgi:hypothetical protein